MRAKMLVRAQGSLREFYAEPGRWSDRGLPYVFRNRVHAERYIAEHDWKYEVKDYDINYQEKIKKHSLEAREDAFD